MIHSVRCLSSRSFSSCFEAAKISEARGSPALKNRVILYVYHCSRKMLSPFVHTLSPFMQFLSGTLFPCIYMKGFGKKF
jgi:hypothetical protein